MHEERTQPASKRRRQLAREQGYVVHSPTLAAAGGWFAALVVLWIISEQVGKDLTDIVRGCILNAGAASGYPAEFVRNLREAAMTTAWPLAAGLFSFFVGSVIVHQAQVRGLWATGLLAPTPARLWSGLTGDTLFLRFRAARWTLIEATVLVLSTAFMVCWCWSEIMRLNDLEGAALAHAIRTTLLQVASVLVATLLLLGLLDLGFRRRRFEKTLRATRREHREDQRVLEGDRTSKAARRQLAQAWRRD
jgi:flagellar biosynthesis protein FlhB